MKKILTIILCLAIASCARNLNANNVVSTDEVGIVNQGTILSVRNVVVDSSDKLEENGMGLLAGGAVGGIAGSGVGGGTGKGLATAGGVIAGAALGAAIQEELSKSDGIEYIVKLDSAKNKKYQDYREESEIALSRDNIKDKLKKTINTPDTESNLISVVQGTDVLLQAGQKVYVIYSTDRIRLVPAN